MKKRFGIIVSSLVLFIPCLMMNACRKDNGNEWKLPENKSEILVSPYDDINKGELLIFDSSGNNLFERNIDGAVLNFQKWNLNNKIRYSYFRYNSSYTIPVLGTALGDMIVTDEHLNEIRRIRLLPHGSRTVEDPDLLDSHDFILLDDDHYIVMTYYLQTVHNIPAELHPVANSRVLAPIIQEVQNGEVIWEWNGTDYPEFYSNSVESNFSDTSIQDHMHLNSFFVDPRDNNIICSFRNQDQVIKINRKNGSILWRLGGKSSDFPLTADQRFLRQHHATLVDNNNTLLLFDNGEINQRPYSRVLEFQLDEDDKTVKGFKSLVLPGNMFSQFMGSVQKKDSTYFIGGGSVPKILELNFETGHIIMEKTLDYKSYRAFKY